MQKPGVFASEDQGSLCSLRAVSSPQFSKVALHKKQKLQYLLHDFTHCFCFSPEGQVHKNCQEGQKTHKAWLQCCGNVQPQWSLEECSRAGQQAPIQIDGQQAAHSRGRNSQRHLIGQIAAPAAFPWKHLHMETHRSRTAAHLTLWILAVKCLEQKHCRFV